VARWVAPDGVGIEYEVTGSGPAVMLLHGFGSNTEVNWVRTGVLDALAEAGHTVVAYDARGHGLSDAPHEESAYAGSAMVDDATGLIEHLGLGELAVVGYSMGAQVAVRLAARHPAVRRAVLGGAGSRLLAPQPGERPYPADAIAAALEADDPASITDPVARSYRAFADATGADRLALAALQRARAADDRTGALLARLEVPVLVVVGERDTLVGDPGALVGALPRARLEVVPGDHLSAVASPAFATAVVRFLAA
jgi:pimeloyl-ACP methyl ester carboxylesterase